MDPIAIVFAMDLAARLQAMEQEVTLHPLLIIAFPIVLDKIVPARVSEISVIVLVMVTLAHPILQILKPLHYVLD